MDLYTDEYFMRKALKEAQKALEISYLQYLIQPQRTLVFSFNCSRRDRETWEETARSMMNNVKVK